MKFLAQQVVFKIINTSSDLSHIRGENNDGSEESNPQGNMISVKRQGEEYLSKCSGARMVDQLQIHRGEHVSNAEQKSNRYDNGSIGCSSEEVEPPATYDVKGLSRRLVCRRVSVISDYIVLIQLVPYLHAFPSCAWGNSTDSSVSFRMGHSEFFIAATC